MSEQQSLALTGGAVAKPAHHDLECGCRIVIDPDGPAWVIKPCAEHLAQSEATSHRLMRLMGEELDDLVKHALTGKALEPRLRPKDAFR